MKIRVYVLPLVVLLLAWPVRMSGQAPSTPQAPPVFPAGVDLVTVDVVVLDRDGRPVEGLTASDFTVKEAGQPQAIAAFEAVSLRESPPARRGTQRVSTNTDRPDSAGRWFFIVLDDLNISQFATPRAREAMVQFVERGLRPGDSVMIAPTSGGAWWTGTLPQDRESLIAFLKRFEGTYRPDTSSARLWDHEAMGIALGRDPQALARVARRYFEQNIIPEAYPMDREIRQSLDVSPGLAMIQTKARQVYKEATNRLRGSLDTLERISTAVAQMRGRKTLLLVSEGFIMDPTQSEFRELVQSARNANAAVHFVDVRGSQGALGQAGMPGGDAEYGAALQQDDTNALAFASLEADGARSVAIDTGGRVVAGVKLVDDLTRIADENRNYYLLGYTPTNTKRDGRFRKIEVTVARPEVEIRARGGYYAPSDKDPKPPEPDTLAPAVRAALLAPFDTPGLPLRLTSYVFGQQTDGGMQVLLLSELDPAPLSNDAKEGLSSVLESYVLIHGRDSGNVERSEKLVELEMPPDIFAQARRSWVPLRRDFTLPPGHYQASFVVRDRGTGLVGSVRHAFDVPAAGAFRASTPILTDAVQSAAMSGQPPRPVPIARRQFEPGARLFCVFEVYGAATDAAAGGPRVSVGYSLVRADGSEVAAFPPQPVRAGALGQVSVTIGLTLPEQAAGEHELRVTVRDEVSTRTLEISEPLVIARP